jgi:hypothetical protein
MVAGAATAGVGALVVVNMGPAATQAGWGLVRKGVGAVTTTAPAVWFKTRHLVDRLDRPECARHGQPSRSPASPTRSPMLASLDTLRLLAEAVPADRLVGGVVVLAGTLWSARGHGSAWMIAGGLLTVAVVLDVGTGLVRPALTTAAVLCLLVGLTRAHHATRAAVRAAEPAAARDASPELTARPVADGPP